MDNFYDLHTIINSLKCESNREKQIHLLQSLNTLFLTKYIIKIKDLTIVPIWVEAYYHHPIYFPDESCHKNPKQKNNFGGIYQHAKTEINGGVDICLSKDDDYYLSILIKASLINGEYCKQERANGKLLELGIKEEALPVILQEMPRSYAICHANRIGLSPREYYQEPLGSFPIDLLKEYDFAFPNGYKKQWRHAFYELLHHEDVGEALAAAKISIGSVVDKNTRPIALESFEDYKASGRRSIIFKSHSK